MASPQPTDSHTRLSNELYSQILMRDFSKRQRSILDLIIRLSYGCGKKTAYIPKLQYFEICGVHQKIVGSELNGLKALNVIQADAATKSYWINKDYDTWLTEPPTEQQEVSLGQLVALNIRIRADQQNIGDDQQNIGELPEDHQQNVGENTNKTLVESPIKHWCSEPEIPSGTGADGVSITKDNYIYKKILEEGEEKTPLDKYWFQLLKHGNQVFEPYGMSQATAHDMASLLVKEMLPVELGYEAINVTKSIGYDEKFAPTKLRRWLQSGIKDVESAKRHEDKVYNSKRESVESKRGVTNGEHRKPTPDDEWNNIDEQFFGS